MRNRIRHAEDGVEVGSEECAERGSKENLGCRIGCEIENMV